MIKVLLYIVAFLLFHSCKEKPKSFAYDYIEIAYEVRLQNNCESTVFNIKMNPDSFYLSFFGSKDCQVALRNSDSLEIEIDKFAQKLYNDSIKNTHVHLDTISTLQPFFVFIVCKDGIKKYYKEYPCLVNKDTCGDRRTVFIKQSIINNEKKLVAKNCTLNTEAIKIILPEFY
jgi:hypothetical protein